MSHIKLIIFNLNDILKPYEADIRKIVNVFMKCNEQISQNDWDAKYANKSLYQVMADLAIQEYEVDILRDLVAESAPTALTEDFWDSISTLRDSGLSIRMISRFDSITTRDIFQKHKLYLYPICYCLDRYPNQQLSPSRYLYAMADANAAPYETLIFTSNNVAHKAATKACAFVCPIQKPEDFSLEKVEQFVHLQVRS